MIKELTKPRWRFLIVSYVLLYTAENLIYKFCNKCLYIINACILKSMILNAIICLHLESQILISYSSTVFLLWRAQHCCNDWKE